MRSRNVEIESLEDESATEPNNSTETYTFIHKLPSHSSILYCYASQGLPKMELDPEKALSVLESVDLSNRFTNNNLDNYNMPEEIKMFADRKFTRESVKAAVKTALKCKSDSGYERLQGFAENVRTLTMDMGVLNTIKYILPKIPIILVIFL